jgi:hypothetical protein
MELTRRDAIGAGLLVVILTALIVLLVIAALPH